MPDPDRAFCEIDRVLKGGYGLIAPAWNCRPWTVKKIEQRPSTELNLFEKIESLSIPLRNKIAYRALMALPQRIWAERKICLSSVEAIPLRYRELHPRWDLIEQSGPVSDDAVASIGPHAGIFLSKPRL